MDSQEEAGCGRLNAIDAPRGVDPRVRWGSDVAAQALRNLGVPYIALNPGASYRGLHDSLVNHLGNHAPEILMCLHEEHAVAIAHGYAKATGRPMAVAVHSNVGLMHASMAIFNAWCDRVPMLIIGATGPLDATLRRPWIDWVHTSQDQGGLVRNFVKWDDQPGSVAALPESIYRAWQQTATPPHGPVYVCLDAAIQEQEVLHPVSVPDPARYAPAQASRGSAEAMRRAVGILARARRPVILFGRCRRTREAWEQRVQLAERLGAAMLSDLRAGAMVPSDHALHVGEPFNKLSKPARAVLREADAILSLGWIDLGGLLRESFGDREVPCPVIQVGQDMHLHNGWGKEHLALPPADVTVLGDPDEAVIEFLAGIANAGHRPGWFSPERKAPEAPQAGEPLNLRHVALELARAAGDQPVTFPCLPRGWPSECFPHRDPLAYLGKDGGGGLGSGPGLTIGAALALKDSGRLTVSVLGDGDCLMGINAWWTAARYGLPLLAIVANNRSYYNDELHQQGVALQRGRNPDNRWIGLSIDHPAPDIAALARGMGLAGIGPVQEAQGLRAALDEALGQVRAGRACLVDVHIDPAAGRELSESSMAGRSMAKSV